MKLIYDSRAARDVFAPEPPFPRWDKGMDTVQPLIYGGGSSSPTCKGLVTLDGTNKLALHMRLPYADQLNKFSFYSNGKSGAATLTFNIYPDDGTGNPNDAATSLGTGAGIALADYAVTNVTGLTINLPAGDYWIVLHNPVGATTINAYCGSNAVFGGFYAAVKTSAGWQRFSNDHHGAYMEFASGLKFGLPAIVAQAFTAGMDLSSEKIHVTGKMPGISWKADCAQYVYGFRTHMSFAGTFANLVTAGGGIVGRGYVGTDGSTLAYSAETVANVKQIWKDGDNKYIAAGEEGKVDFLFPSPMFVDRNQRAALVVACALGNATDYYRIVEYNQLPSAGNIGKSSQFERMYGIGPNYSAAGVALADPAVNTNGFPFMPIFRMLR